MAYENFIFVDCENNIPIATKESIIEGEPVPFSFDSEAVYVTDGFAEFQADLLFSSDVAFIFRGNNAGLANSTAYYDLDNYLFQNQDSIISYFNLDVSSTSPTSPTTLTELQTLISTYNSSYPNDAFLCPENQSSLSSLSGNGCEYIDGDILNVIGRDYPMTVVRSFYGVVADNSYTVLYDLVSESGAKVTAPENLVSRYVTVTTP